MAFTRNWLKSLSLTDEQVSAIIEEHTSVTDALKAQRDEAKEQAANLKKDADRIPELEKEIEGLKGGEDYKAKWEQAKKDLDDYKAEVSQKEEAEKVKAAYKKLLTDEKIKDDRIEMVMRHTDFADMKLDKDGNLENADALKKTINDDWGVFRVTVKERKQSVSTPPDSGSTGTGMSRAKELAQKFAQERYGVKPDTGKE